MYHVSCIVDESSLIRVSFHILETGMHCLIVFRVKCGVPPHLILVCTRLGLDFRNLSIHHDFFRSEGRPTDAKSKF